MPRPFYLLVLLILCCPTLSQAQTPRPVHVGYYEFAPYAYTDELGQPRGTGLELVAHLLKTAGYSAVFRAYPGARLYSGLADGSIDLWFGAAGKAELATHTLESRNHFGHVTLNLYYRENQPPPVLPAALKNARVIVITGYSYWRDVNHWLNDPELDITRHHTSSHLAALQMLKRGRGDYLLDYAVPVQQALAENALEPMPYLELQRLPLHLIISRQRSDAAQLRDALDQVADSLSPMRKLLRY